MSSNLNWEQKSLWIKKHIFCIWLTNWKNLFENSMSNFQNSLENSIQSIEKYKIWSRIWSFLELRLNNYFCCWSVLIKILKLHAICLNFSKIPRKEWYIIHFKKNSNNRTSVVEFWIKIAKYIKKHKNVSFFKNSYFFRFLSIKIV